MVAPVQVLIKNEEEQINTFTLDKLKCDLAVIIFSRFFLLF